MTLTWCLSVHVIRWRRGGPAASAELGLPEATVTDAAGDLLISDTGSSRIREVAG